MINEIVIPERLKIYDFRSNLIVDRNNPILIQKAGRDRFSGDSFWKKGKDGGKAYIGVQHGEDAMTWNVFRSLQKEGQRGCEIISWVLGLSRVEKILFWGCDVESHSEVQQLLNILIRTTDGKLQGTMTEPDLVIITDIEVAFVECKLNLSGRQSPWKAQQGAPGRESGAFKRMGIYKKIFPELDSVKDWQDIYQLIRQYVYASLLAGELNKTTEVKREPVVIPLINKEHISGEHGDALTRLFEKSKHSPLGKNGVFRDYVTWQDLFDAISRLDLKCGPTLQKQMWAALEASKK